MKENPNYYAIIPAEVRYADIPPNAKLLYGEITALCNKEGFCWATNQYFAKLYGVHKNSIGRLVAILIEKKFIKIKTKKSQKGGGVSTIRLIGINNFVEGGINNFVEYNNTSINNTNTIVENKFSTPVSDKKKEESDRKSKNMNVEQFYEWTKKSKHKHILLIGEWADTVKPDLRTIGQWEQYIVRNVKVAKKLTLFSQDQIEKAYGEIIKEQKRLDYTPAMETLFKKITK
jgi:hypothetical protein